jgi:hypothetical protein
MSQKNADDRYIFAEVHRPLDILLAISAHAINDWGIAGGLADTELALVERQRRRRQIA